MSDITIAPVTAPLGGEWAGMTFPSYRASMALAGTDLVDPLGNRTIACVATEGGAPAGLILAQLPPDLAEPAEVLSLFVRTDLRGRGVGTALVAGVEDAARAAGRREVMGVYTTGKPAIDAVERIFVKRGFSEPVIRKALVRITPEQATTTDWWHSGRFPSDSEPFLWTELTDAERDQIKRSHEEKPWIDQDLEPWRSEGLCDPVSSVGLRRRGEVVGWILNHRVPPDLVRFTTAFVRKDFQRLGSLFPLLKYSIERIMNQGLTIIFVTSADYPRMLPFVLKRIGPFGNFCGETRGVSKAL